MRFSKFSNSVSPYFIALFCAGLALFLGAWLVFQLHQAVTEQRGPHPSRHLTEQEMWPDIAHCDSDLWNCVREPMARSDI